MGGAREVGDEAGAGEAAEVGEETFAKDGGGGGISAEVADAGNRVAEEDVVGADASALEFGAELSHDGGVVVDAFEEDALVGDGDAVVDEAGAGGDGL